MEEVKDEVQVRKNKNKTIIITRSGKLDRNKKLNININTESICVYGTSTKLLH